jgi:hypothetical protein
MCGFCNLLVCVSVGFVMCGCVCLWGLYCVGVLVMRVLVFTIFCIVCIVFLFCFVYVYSYLLLV